MPEHISVVGSLSAETIARFALAYSASGRAADELGATTKLFEPSRAQRNDPRVLRAFRKGARTRIPTKSTEEFLFDRKAMLKSTANYLSFRLGGMKREIFKQLDFVLDVDDWDAADELPHQDAFSGYLKFLIYYQPHFVPSFGVGGSGQILCAWVDQTARLMLEFADVTHVVWTFVETSEDGEVAGGRAQQQRIGEVLAPYSPGRWFAKT